MLALYDYFRSSASFRVRITLNLKNLSYDIIPIHLVNQGGEQHLPEYLAVNPAGLVPSLKTDSGIITQSLAIIEWLEDTYPTPSVFPTEIYQKALARSVALSIAADIHPLNNLRVLNFLNQAYSITNEQKQMWYAHWVEKGLIALESQLNHWQTSGKFCFGDQPSIADVCLIPQIFNAKRFNCNIHKLHTINKITHHCESHPAFQKAWPKEQ